MVKLFAPDQNMVLWSGIIVTVIKVHVNLFSSCFFYANATLSLFVFVHKVAAMLWKLKCNRQNGD